MNHAHTQLNHFATDSIMDASPYPEIVAVLTQIMVQLLLVELEAVATSVDDAATFVGDTNNYGGGCTPTDFNTGAFSAWLFLLCALSSLSV